jgi:hypothetical protein
MWTLPKFAMQVADVLVYPSWTDSNVDLVVDIQPSGTAGGLRIGKIPMEADVPFTHYGFLDDLGPIDKLNPSGHRLRKDGVQYAILRVKDWDGFYVLDLDEVVGA